MTIATTIKSLRERIEKAASGPLAAPGITLLAACKAQLESLIREAIEAGIIDFGENRVQEAAEKWPALKKAYPQVRLHLIGPLQSNKVKEALELFDVIQTIDRVKIAEALAKIPHEGKSFYIQINTGKEPQKSGVIPEEADALIEHCVKKLHLPITGLMCVPPHGQPTAPHFALLKKIADRHGLKELSMGMSEDFETAVRMGSTCVRIGRGLFGERTLEV